MTWRCRVCGHKTTADEQPASCPHCGQPGTELSADDPRPEPQPPEYPTGRERLQPRIRMPQRGERQGERVPRPGRKRSEDPAKPIRWA